jgi:integrase
MLAYPAQRWGDRPASELLRCRSRPHPYVSVCASDAMIIRSTKTRRALEPLSERHGFLSQALSFARLTARLGVRAYIFDSFGLAFCFCVEELLPCLPAESWPRSYPSPLSQAERLQKIRPLSWQARDAMLAASKSDRLHHALLATLAKAGLRPGEGMTLRSGDIDFKALAGTGRYRRRTGGRTARRTRSHRRSNA